MIHFSFIMLSFTAISNKKSVKGAKGVTVQSAQLSDQSAQLSAEEEQSLLLPKSAPTQSNVGGECL